MTIDNLPDNFKGIEGEEEATYIFEIGGEVKVEGYSEASAEEHFKINRAELLKQAFDNGDLYICE